MAQHTLLRGMMALGVVSAIILTVGLAVPSAFANDEIGRASCRERVCMLV